MKELEHSKTLDHPQTNRIDNQGIAVISDVLAAKVNNSLFSIPVDHYPKFSFIFLLGHWLSAKRCFFYYFIEQKIINFF